MPRFFPDAAEHYASFRSWIWSEGLALSRSERVCEPRGEKRPEESELEIQARWFGGEFGRRFTGTEGEEIEIVQFGHWNRSAGPDFTEAAVRIDGTLHAGAIELDLDARDWEQHGHGANPAFEEVVLHVFTDGPAWTRSFTRTLAHRNVVQVQLPQYAWSQGPPDFLPEAFPGRCVAPLSRMTDSEVESLLLSAAQYRIREKTRRLEVMSGSTSSDQALFQAIAEALGFRANKMAMAILAQRCPISELRRLEPREREARLFGAAGFLDRGIVEERSKEESGVYLRALWDSWWKMRSEVETDRKRAISWIFSGNRPVNHPQRRVGALVTVVDQWETWRRWWNNPVNNLESIVNNSLNNLHHRFWDHHFTLKAQPSERRLRLIGQDRLRDILGNVIFPGAIGRKESCWEQFLAMRRVDSNQKLRRAGLRLFGPDEKRQKLFTSYYHQQQGLLQIYQDFCLEDVSDCAHCPFPEQLLQWKESEDMRERAS